MVESELIFLLSEDDKNQLSKKLKEDGYDTPDQLRNQLLKNIQSNLEFTSIDVDIICMFDLQINYKIFITSDEILTREEVIKKYNLEKFKIEPEQLFNQQSIEVIDGDYFIFDKECENRVPQKIYNTKVYIGKEKWKDFMITFRFMRSLSFISDIKLSIENTNEKNKNSKENKNSEENKDIRYIGKLIDQVLNNET